jgi:DNA-binding Lrp family transcriptional regulator
MAPDVVRPESLSEQERSVITLIQTSFPLVRRPFDALGERLGLSGETVLALVGGLKEAGLIRKIGPVLEPVRFGVASELVAARVAPEQLEEVGTAVSQWHPVTHCYARSHAINLWLAALSADRRWFEAAREELLAMPGVSGVWRLPALRRFKVAVRFDLAEGKEDAEESFAEPDDEASPAATSSPPEGDQGAIDLRLLAALEEDLPLCLEPFAALAESRDLREDAVLSTLVRWKADGRIRRYGALVRHLRLGIAANAMTVWRVPARRVVETGTGLASSAHVSHCYERPSFPEFPFNLYAMVHARSRADCLSAVEELSAHCRDCPRAVLFSTREFRKTSPRFAELLGEGASSVYAVPREVDVGGIDEFQDRDSAR